MCDDTNTSRRQSSGLPPLLHLWTGDGGNGRCPCSCQYTRRGATCRLQSSGRTRRMAHAARPRAASRSASPTARIRPPQSRRLFAPLREWLQKHITAAVLRTAAVLLKRCRHRVAGERGSKVSGFIAGSVYSFLYGVPPLGPPRCFLSGGKSAEPGPWGLRLCG